MNWAAHSSPIQSRHFAVRTAIWRHWLVWMLSESGLKGTSRSRSCAAVGRAILDILRSSAYRHLIDFEHVGSGKYLLPSEWEEELCTLHQEST